MDVYEAIKDLPAPYYDDGEGRVIFCGDCRELLPGVGKVDLVLTDPPYGIAFDASKNHPNAKFTQIIAGDKVGEMINPAVYIIGRKNIVWGASCLAHLLPPQPAWIGWDKSTRPVPGHRSAEFDMAWTDCIRRSVMFRFMWSGAFRESERDYHVHPTQKPLSLMKWCIDTVAKATGTVLDPFLGSGTTLRAAKDLGRQAIGIEIEERYCEIAANRLRQKVLF